MRKPISQEDLVWFKDEKIQAWLKNGAFEHVADYLRRGRHYAKISDEALVEAWVACMKVHCSDPGDPIKFRAQNDLDAESDLRQLIMPLERVADDLEIRRQHLVKRIEEMKKDPEEWERANNEMLNDMANFIVDLEDAKETSN